MQQPPSKKRLRRARRCARCSPQGLKHSLCHSLRILDLRASESTSLACRARAGLAERRDQQAPRSRAAATKSLQQSRAPPSAQPLLHCQRAQDTRVEHSPDDHGAAHGRARDDGCGERGERERNGEREASATRERQRRHTRARAAMLQAVARRLPLAPQADGWAEAVSSLASAASKSRLLSPGRAAERTPTAD